MRHDERGDYSVTILIELNPAGQPEEVSAETVFTRVRDQYYEEVSTPDAYLKDCYNVTFGKTDPSSIIQLAQGWNNMLLKDFLEAQANYMKVLGTDGVKSFDTPASYALKCAVAAIDNSFYEFSDCAIYTQDTPYFTTVMTDELLTAVLSEPERFALIEVTPK